MDNELNEQNNFIMYTTDDGQVDIGPQAILNCKNKKYFPLNMGRARAAPI